MWKKKTDPEKGFFENKFKQSVRKPWRTEEDCQIPLFETSCLILILQCIVHNLS